MNLFDYTIKSPRTQEIKTRGIHKANPITNIK